MKVTYDADADAAYIYLTDIKAVAVDTQGDWPFHVDIDKDGNVIGIEVMDAKSILSESYLSKSQKLS